MDDEDDEDMVKQRNNIGYGNGMPTQTSRPYRPYDTNDVEDDDDDKSSGSMGPKALSLHCALLMYLLPVFMLVIGR